MGTLVDTGWLVVGAAVVGRLVDSGWLVGEDTRVGVLVFSSVWVGPGLGADVVGGIVLVKTIEGTRVGCSNDVGEGRGDGESVVVVAWDGEGVDRGRMVITIGRAAVGELVGSSVVGRGAALGERVGVGVRGRVVVGTTVGCPDRADGPVCGGTAGFDDNDDHG